jgi:hypothetical protein
MFWVLTLPFLLTVFSIAMLLYSYQISESFRRIFWVFKEPPFKLNQKTLKKLWKIALMDKVSARICVLLCILV